MVPGSHPPLTPTQYTLPQMKNSSNWRVCVWPASMYLLQLPHAEKNLHRVSRSCYSGALALPGKAIHVSGPRRHAVISTVVPSLVVPLYRPVQTSSFIHR